jgi:hypothetical protein
VNEKLGKRADYLMFNWVQFMSKEYFGVIDAIKKLEIGKCKEVFQSVDGNQCELLRAKLKREFLNAKKNILLRYSCYVNTGAPKLTISINVELAPDPRKYTNSGQEMPKIEMIQIISLKIICIHSGMRLKMTGPSEWIQMDRRFLNLIDLTNC